MSSDWPNYSDYTIHGTNYQSVGTTLPPLPLNRIPNIDDYVILTNDIMYIVKDLKYNYQTKTITYNLLFF